MEKNSYNSLLRLIRKGDQVKAHTWESRGDQRAFELFHKSSKDIPAYKQFLKTKGISPENIRTIEDVRQIPLIDKNYLRKNSLPDLLPNADIHSLTTISSTSGTSGTPVYIPRTEDQDMQYRLVAEMYLRDQFSVDKKTTLGVIGFGLGIWIGGIFTYKTYNLFARENKYPLSLAPIGPNIDIYLRTIKALGKNFDQILLMGYPPFLADIINRGKEFGISWKDYKIRIMSAAEGFSEQFRNEIARVAHLENPYRDIVNIYGTVELGTMAIETPICYAIREATEKNPELALALFGRKDRTPTLAQYIPELTRFELVNEHLVATGTGAAYPLVRYDLRDRGGVIPFDEMKAKLSVANIDIFQLVKIIKCPQTLRTLPFVFVFDRDENSVTLRGANIFADQIKRIINKGTATEYLTGKFSMRVRPHFNRRGAFEIHFEMRPQKEKTKEFLKSFEKDLVARLRSFNSEYDDQYRSVPAIAHPRIQLWAYQHERYFRSGTKHRWVIE